MTSARAVLTLVAVCLAFGGMVFATDTVQSNWRTLGDAPPELNVDFIQGEPITLADAVGKHVVVVEFWATWCGPCKISIPHLTKLQKTYGDRGLVVIGISNEDEATVRPYMEAMGADMDYRVALDRVDTTNNKFFGGFNRQNSYPTAFIIDGNGRVAWIGTAGNPFMDEVIDRLVNDLPRIVAERAERAKDESKPETE